MKYDLEFKLKSLKFFICLSHAHYFNFSQKMEIIEA